MITQNGIIGIALYDTSTNLWEEVQDEEIRKNTENLK